MSHRSSREVDREGSNRAGCLAGPATSPSDLSEISGLRQQIMGNAAIMFADRCHLEVVVISAEYPESGYYAARLVDISERGLLIGVRWAPSIPEALRQLLQETCEALRDSRVLQNYHAVYPSLGSC